MYMFAAMISKKNLKISSPSIKVVIVNTRTGEIFWNPRSSESFFLNGSTSRDAKGYNVKVHVRLI